MALFLCDGVLTDGLTAKRPKADYDWNSDQDISEVPGEPCEVPPALARRRSELIVKGLQSESGVRSGRRRVW